MRPYVLILTLLLTFQVFGQGSQTKKHQEYIVFRETQSYIQGKILHVDSGEFQVKFKAVKDEEFQEFSAGSIMEFGTEEGSVYVSEFIAGKYRFLRKAVDGQHQLLVWNRGDAEENIYFLKKDSSLTEVSRERFNNAQELNLTVKKYGNAIAKETKYTERSLSRAVIYSNSESSFFPSTKYGILLGLNRTSLRLNPIESVKFTPASTLNVGAFVDLPVNVFSNYSFRIEMQYNERSYTYNTGEYSVLGIRGSITSDYLAKIQSISVPILLRYRKPSEKDISWFANFGPSFRRNMSSNNYQITITTNPTVVRVDSLFIPNFMFGAVLGFGLDYSLSYRRDLGIELRYEYKTSGEYSRTRSNAIQAIISISI